MANPISGFGWVGVPQVEERVAEEYQKETGDLYVWEEEIEAAEVAQRDGVLTAQLSFPSFSVLSAFV